ncbi:DNA-processing protein DprA [Amycolatopsis sp. PS_44_ISF1]|uniref:DNA-processing protein DprA n=1 Tax=Amycolatopsis sp. PS_44_ISF1 TaxID=2974917 RepID=UPI0028DF3A04|nr:DNA-processing protein DprA [Amycolatopsis sp. PS_44_ISF1]MDT8915469.1 DNA-processing protein DprA [Amycolatopsis sp. PS_44_ISF1]
MSVVPQAPAASREAERLTRAYLLRVAEPPSPALFALVEARGPVEAAERVRTGECPEKVRKETTARKHLDLAEQDLAKAAEHGARLVIPGDDEWPAWPLHSLELASASGVPDVTPPLALWVWGLASLGSLADRAVAVVGARLCSPYGQNNAGELGHGLAEKQVPLFSGAALGIDAAAHRGALAGCGATVAVLGCGADVSYPSGHERLLQKMVDQGGAVVSEYPPATQPARHRFLVRNRLIAALTDGTVVVEAGRRSGARNTATTAGALGKVVMAMPGPVHSRSSTGCHDLIRDGKATLVASVDDVLETVGRFGPPREDTEQPRPTDGLGRESERVYEALVPRAGRSAEEVAAESGIPVPRVRAVLPELELDGFAVRGETGWRRIVRSTPLGNFS